MRTSPDRLLTAVRVICGAVILVGAAVIALGWFAPRLVADDALRAAVLARVEAALGRTVEAADAELVAFPRPAVRLVGLEGEGLRLRELSARLALGPLLLGRLEPVRLRLADGHLALGPPADPGAVDGALMRLGVERVELERVTLDLGARELNVREARLDREGAAVSVNGLSVWNGEEVRFAAKTGDLAGLEGGTEGSLELTSERSTIDFTGRLDLSGPVAGRVAVDAPALGPALDWLGLPADGASAVRFELEGRTSATAWGWELHEAEVALGDLRGDGVLGLVKGERPTLNGTLAFDAIETGLDPLRRMARGVGAGFDADVRFSAASITLGQFRMANVAAALRADQRQVTFELGDATHADGRVVGTLSLPRAQDAVASAELRLLGVSSDALASSILAGAPRMAGRANVTAKLTWDADRPNVRARFELRDGRVEGLDLRAIVRSGFRLEPDEARDRVTPFDVLDGEAELADGFLRLFDLKLLAPGLAARMEGRIDVARGVPALSGEVATVGVVTDASDDGGLSLAPNATAFFIGGTLAEPLIVPIERR